MVSFKPAAPLDGPALLPDALVDQYVKPEGEDQALLLTAMRLTALGWVERHTSHSLQRRLWTATFDRSDAVVSLPVQPVRSVTSIAYADPTGVVITGTDIWQLGAGALYPALAGAWPATANRAGAVVVTFDAGYDDVAAEAPALQIAALMMLMHLFRGGSVEDVPKTVALLLDEQYRTPVMR